MTASTDDKRLLGARPGGTAAAAAGSWLWTQSGGPLSAVLSALEVNAVNLAQRFSERSSLLHIVQSRCQVGADSARAAVDRLEQLGILIQPQAYLATQRALQPRIGEPLLAIRTWRRPQALQRLLDSLDADAALWNRRRNIVVIDDDRESGSASETVVREHAGRSRNELHYFGAAQREPLVERLLLDVAARERELFGALLSPCYSDARNGSRTWNWAQLFGAGGALSILDDDLRFPACQMPGRLPGIEALNSAQSDTLFIDPPEKIDPPPLDRDVYELARDFVGQPARAIAQAQQIDIPLLAGTAVNALSYLETDPTILAAYGGVYGELAWDSSAWLNMPNVLGTPSLFAEPYRHQRLRADRIVHGLRRPRLTAYAVYTPLLLDCRQPSAFATDWGKADDTFAHALLAVIEPRTAFVHLPSLLGHWPVETRDRLARSEQAMLLDPGAFMAALLVRLGNGLRSGDRVQRLAALGALCEDWSLAGDDSLRAEYQGWQQSRYAGCVASFTAVVESTPNAPAEWRSYMARVIAANRTAVETCTLDAQLAPLFRRALGQLAIASRRWPGLWQRFSELPAGQRGSLRLN